MLEVARRCSSLTVLELSRSELPFKVGDVTLMVRHEDRKVRKVVAWCVLTSKSLLRLECVAFDRKYRFFVTLCTLAPLDEPCFRWNSTMQIVGLLRCPRMATVISFQFKKTNYIDLHGGANVVHCRSMICRNIFYLFCLSNKTLGDAGSPLYAFLLSQPITQSIRLAH